MAFQFWNMLSNAVFAEDTQYCQIVYNGKLTSPFFVSELLAETVGIMGAAVARLTNQTIENVKVDGRLTDLWCDTSYQPQGWQMPNMWDPLSNIYQGADGWIRLHTNAKHHKAAALRVLNVSKNTNQVAQAIATWPVTTLEDAIIAQGGVAAQMLSPTQWRAHPQGRAVSQEPIVHWMTKPATASKKMKNADYKTNRPLAGLRVLDLTRVLAGPVATRMLAGYGANVLRIDPPQWDDDGLLQDTTLGKRCAGLDLHAQQDRIIFENLLSEADIFVHGYRSDALANIGYNSKTIERLNSNLIEVCLNAYGWTGPWATRRGFDSIVQLSTGIAEVCATDASPGKLPVQALDHAAGFLMAACVFEAIKRAQKGEVSYARISLARLSHLLQSVGIQNNPPTPFMPRNQADFSTILEKSEWGLLHRLHPMLSVPGANIFWDLPSGSLRKDPATW